MFIITLVFLLLCAGIGYAAAGPQSKVLGAILGGLLGPLGIVIAIFACKD